MIVHYENEIHFIDPDHVTIEGVDADMSSTSSPSTAYQQSPFLANFNLRLILPRILIIGENNKLSVSTVCFGKGWTKKPKPALGVCSYSLNSINMDEAWKEIIALQIKDYVLEQLLEQAILFKQKSDLFSQYGICPPVRKILEIKKINLITFWPRNAFVNVRKTGSLHFEYNLQVSKEYLDKFGLIYAVEVENAHLLHPGSWIIKDGKAYNRFIKKEYLGAHGGFGQFEDSGGAIKTNFINGYYIDWDIFGCDKDILNV